MITNDVEVGIKVQNKIIFTQDSALETCHLVDFTISPDQRGKKERKWKDRQILGPCPRVEKAVKHEGDSDTSCSWCLWKRNWVNRRSEEESRLSRPQHC